MNFLSFLNFFDFLLYFYIAEYALIKNRKSQLNQACSMFTFCFCIWSFGMIFIQNPFISKSTVRLIHSLASFGWIAFASFFIWFILIFTENNKILKSKLTFPFLFGIPAVFIHEQFRGRLISDYIKQSWGWAHVWSNSIWPYLFYLYYSLFIGIGLYLTLNFIRTSSSIPKKKSAIVILSTVAFSLVAASLTDVVLPRMNIYTTPNLASFFVLVWALGLVYAMVRYKFLSITPYIATENIISAMADSLILLNEDLTIVFINNATSDLLGCHSNELIGKRVEILFPEGFKSIQLNEILQEQGIRHYDFYLQTKSGKDIPVIFTVSPLLEATGELIGTVCIVKDISERKKVEDALKDAYIKLKEIQNQLVQAEKMNAIGQLASGVAHEVRNPLGIILQGINYLGSRLSAEDGDILETLTMLKNSISRADNIIDSLLDFSRATELALKAEGINSILENSLTLVKARLKFENIDTSIEIEKGIPKVLADRNRLEQVFINILLNAAQAMPNGGKIVIRSFDKELEEIRNGIGRRAQDNFQLGERVVIVEIEDTGIGIPEENLKRIFDPFFTTKSQRGVGLGLSVTRNIIYMHRGLIYVESKPGQGTKVTVILKVAQT